jgi:phosphatidate phosphatase APP1
MAFRQPPRNQSPPRNLIVRSPKKTSAPADAEPSPVAETAQYVSDAPLDIRLIDEPEFRGGNSVELKALVTRAALNGRTPAAKVKVVFKTLSTSFSPNKVEALTDDAGVATVSLTFPRFRGGRAAVLVQVEDQAVRAELRRIIVPSG